PAAEKKGHKLTITMPSELPGITGNPDYLQRAIVNLLENAIKYTRDSGEIGISVNRQDGAVVVKVSDSGIGIAPEDQPRIFERFYRADRSRSREMGGTGLGLSIVKHVAQSHGGCIEVASTL